MGHFSVIDLKTKGDTSLAFALVLGIQLNETERTALDCGLAYRKSRLVTPLASTLILLVINDHLTGLVLQPRSLTLHYRHKCPKQEDFVVVVGV